MGSSTSDTSSNGNIEYSNDAVEFEPNIAITANIIGTPTFGDNYATHISGKLTTLSNNFNTNITENLTTFPYDFTTNASINLTDLHDNFTTSISENLTTLSGNYTNISENLTTLSFYLNTNISENLTTISGNFTTNIPENLTTLYDNFITNKPINLTTSSGNFTTNISENLTTLFHNFPTKISENLTIFSDDFSINSSENLITFNDNFTKISENLTIFSDNFTTIPKNLTALLDNITNIPENLTSLFKFTTNFPENLTEIYNNVTSLYNGTSQFSIADIYNKTITTTESMEANVAEMLDTVVCQSPYFLCNSTLQGSYCFNGGTCCQQEHILFCACPDEFEGPRCMRFKFLETFESSERTLKMTFLSSVTSLFIALVCLVILLFVVVMAWKKMKEKNAAIQNRTNALDSEMMYVQGELEKLPASEKMNRLAKLSKIVEATARAAILSFPSLVSPQPFNPNKHPLSMARSASEPTDLNFQFQNFDIEQRPRAKSARLFINGHVKTPV